MELEDILYPVHPLLIKILRRILHLSSSKCWIRDSVICIFTNVNLKHIAKRIGIRIQMMKAICFEF